MNIVLIPVQNGNLHVCVYMHTPESIFTVLVSVLKENITLHTEIIMNCKMSAQPISRRSLRQFSNSCHSEDLGSRAQNSSNSSLEIS